MDFIKIFNTCCALVPCLLFHLVCHPFPSPSNRNESLWDKEAGALLGAGIDLNHKAALSEQYFRQVRVKELFH